MKRSKKYNEAAAKVTKDHLYTPLEAVTLAKETSTVKYNASIEVALVLGVDPKKADQAIRSTVNLPHGTGKTSRVLVFANGDKADAARAAGADIVGGDELIEEVAKGRLDYDAVVSTPDLMGKVGRLGKVLGPRGLMPNPKTGTVTTDVAKAVSDIKGGKIEFRVDKNSNLHFLIGKASLPPSSLQITTQLQWKRLCAQSQTHQRVATYKRQLSQQRWDLESQLIPTSSASLQATKNLTRVGQPAYPYPITKDRRSETTARLLQ